MRRFARYLRRFLHAVLLAAALAICVAAGVLLWLERSGWLAETLDAELTGRLRRTGGEVAVGRVTLDWFAPAALLEDVRLERRGRLAQFDRVYVQFSPTRRGGRGWIERVDVEGGRMRLCQDLIDVFAGVETGEGPAGADVERALPRITVRRVALDLAHPTWGELPIGEADFVCALDEDARPRIEGRILPSLAARGSTSAIYLGGREERAGVLAVHLSTEGFEIGADAMPKGSILERFQSLDPHGVLRLDASARLSAVGGEPSKITLRASLVSGSFRAPTSTIPVDAVNAEVEAHYDPRPGETWTEPLAWQSRAHLEARWNSARFSSEVVFGRNAGEGRIAEVALACPELPADRSTLAGLGVERWLGATWNALEPRGVADVACGLRLARDFTAELCVDLRADGGAGVTYRGWTDLHGKHEGGFPLPVDSARGRLVAVFDPRRARPTHVGLLDLAAVHGGGTLESHSVRCSGLIVARDRARLSPDAVPRATPPELALSISARNLSANEALRKALEGLPEARWVWPAFSPRDGSFDATAELFLAHDSRHLAARVDADFRGASLTWEEVPIPLESAQGHLALSFDSAPAFGVAFAATGATPTAESVRVRGRVQQDPSRIAHGTAAAGHAIRASELLQGIEIDAQGMALRGSDRTVIEAVWPGVGAALEEFAPAGKANVRFRGARALPGAPFEYEVEVEPQQVQVTPRTFNMPTRNVAGRVLVQGEEPADAAAGGGSRVETRLAPLVGEWSGNARVAASALFSAAGAGAIELYGAGIDVTNRALAGAFREAFASGPQRAEDAFDLSSLSIDGRVDFAGRMAMAGANGGGASSYRVYLRDNDFRTAAESGFGLQSLRGVLVQEGGVLRGERIFALLARTPVELADARFVDQDGGYRFDTRISARGLPLDRDHLRFILDERTLDSLVEHMNLRGELDIADARLALSGAPGKEQVSFEGRVTPRGMGMDLGLPLRVDSAAVELEKLVFENGRVRAWARVSDLDGAIADRRLSGARFLVTYVEPHLALIDLAGSLEDGEIHDLAHSPGDASDTQPRLGGTAFSMDLVEPFSFEIGLKLEDVEIAGILRGMFESDFADTGRLDAELRLAGNLERLTGIAGEGSVHMRDTRLWSIPVMRSLFSQLGFDNTAVFDQMRTRFRLADGVIHMDAIRVNSPLLELVGEGTLDLDGRLHHDLEVRYGLVDRLGPLTRLVYWVQNNLLSVAVRGDMARPRVFLKGALAFLRRNRGTGRELPLPGFSPLPERF